MGNRGFIPLVVLLLWGSLLPVFCQGADGSPEDVAEKSAIFLETFGKGWEDRWLHSKHSDYQGVFKTEKSAGHSDKGLIVPEKARKYGITTLLADPVDVNKDTLVLQYEVRLQEGLECGGAYLKFLQPQEEGWKAEDLKDSTQYSIMFGPDKCGSTNKVHFIFKHKNPVTGEAKEHHLKSPPFPLSDKNTHVYTAVIKPKEQKVVIYIDGEERKTADFKDDFEPPVQPPLEIDDPEDKKPSDWVDAARIPDPDASKPDDWDEDAPREIVDESAGKPEGWLDDEPDQVDDPEASKPEDWDEEEDGEWEAPKVPNPKCTEGPGCGVWTPPLIPNPEFKGKWSAPLIDNPAYKGEWKPAQIPNPDYFEVDTVSLEPIGAVAIEIWTMTDKILFDNIWIGANEVSAKSFRSATSLKKLEKEKEEEEEKRKEEKATPVAGKKTISDWVHTTFEKYPVTAPYADKAKELATLAEKYQITTLTVLSGAVLVFILLIATICRGKPQTVSAAQRKKEDISTPDDAPTAEEEEKTEPAPEDSGKDEIQKEEDSKPRSRRAPRAQ